MGGGVYAELNGSRILCCRVLAVVVDSVFPVGKPQQAAYKLCSRRRQE